MKSYREIAIAMYEGYLAELENGDHEPFWNDLSDNLQDAWVAAARVAHTEFTGVY